MRFRRNGGESNEIIYDDVNRAADREAFERGIIQRLGPNALPGKCGIAVEENRNDPLRPFRADSHLLCARAPHRDRIDGFEMARIRYEMHREAAAVERDEFSGGTEVIFHVAAAEHAARIHVLEARENCRSWPAHYVNHHVQPPAVAHRDDALLRAQACGGIEHFIEERNQRGVAFERIALCAEIASLKNLFKNFGSNEALENSRAIEPWRFGLHALRDPIAPLAIRNVHEFRADAAAIDCAGVGGVFSVNVEFRHCDGLKVSERIEIRL